MYVSWYCWHFLNFYNVRYQCYHRIINNRNNIIELTLFALISLLRVSCSQYQHAGHQDYYSLWLAALVVLVHVAVIFFYSTIVFMNKAVWFLLFNMSILFHHSLLHRFPSKRQLPIILTHPTWISVKYEACKVYNSNQQWLFFVKYVVIKVKKRDFFRPIGRLEFNRPANINSKE